MLISKQSRGNRVTARVALPAEPCCCCNISIFSNPNVIPPKISNIRKFVFISERLMGNKYCNPPRYMHCLKNLSGLIQLVCKNKNSWIYLQGLLKVVFLRAFTLKIDWRIQSVQQNLQIRVYVLGAKHF